MRGAAPALALLILLAAAVACSSSTSEGVNPEQGVSLEAAWGIRVSRVSLTAGGGIVDLRYRVTNAEKAAAALGASAHNHGQPTDEDIKNGPLLIDEASGYAVTEAQIHQTGRVVQERQAPTSGLTYFILFSNTGGLFERGSKASLAIGDLRLEHLVVR